MTKFETTTNVSAAKAKTRAPKPRNFRNLYNPPVPINTEPNIPGGKLIYCEHRKFQKGSRWKFRLSLPWGRLHRSIR